MIPALALPFILVGFPDLSHLERGWCPKHNTDAVNVNLIGPFLKIPVIQPTSEWSSNS